MRKRYLSQIEFVFICFENKAECGMNSSSAGSAISIIENLDMELVGEWHKDLSDIDIILFEVKCSFKLTACEDI